MFSIMYQLDANVDQSVFMNMPTNSEFHSIVKSDEYYATLRELDKKREVLSAVKEPHLLFVHDQD